MKIRRKLPCIFAPQRKFWKPDCMKKIAAVLSMTASCALYAQNLVPNGDFENLTACGGLISNELVCSDGWSEFLSLDDSNTPDLCYTNALFFPPVSTTPHNGHFFLGMECSAGNPEYVQIRLSSPLTAGKTYCVSFYASQYEEGAATPTVGIRFSNTLLTDSPSASGLTAHVSTQLPAQPNIWTAITGSYVASGGEEYLTISGFHNTGTMPFPYVYVDAVQITLCSDESTAGPLDEEIGSDAKPEFFAPNAFTPNGDGTNDVFRIIGPVTRQFELVIYDRWGNEVFRSNDIEQAWTGNNSGGDYYVSDGTYSYHFTAALSATEFLERSGTILLLR